MKRMDGRGLLDSGSPQNAGLSAEGNNRKGQHSTAGVENNQACA